MKTVGGGHKLRCWGVRRTQTWAELTAVVYNLVRLAKVARSPIGAWLAEGHQDPHHRHSETSQAVTDLYQFARMRPYTRSG